MNKVISKKVSLLVVFMMVLSVIVMPNFAEAAQHDPIISKTEAGSYIKAVATGSSDVGYVTITTFGGFNEHTGKNYDNVVRGNILITFPTGTNFSNVSVDLTAQNGFEIILNNTPVTSGTVQLDLTKNNEIELDVSSNPDFIEGSYVITGAIEGEMITVTTEINVDNPRDWLNGDYDVPQGYSAPTPGEYPYTADIENAIDGFDNGETLIFAYNVPVGTTAMDVLRNFDIYHNMDITGLDYGYISYMGRNGYNQIGEFDINYYSGWMYTVDEGLGPYLPNVGASAKILTEDTEMIWHFTMAYGADIDAPWGAPDGTPGMPGTFSLSGDIGSIVPQWANSGRQLEAIK